MSDEPTPPHHVPGGGYRNPWPAATSEPAFGDLLRWRWERLRSDLPPDPGPEEIPREAPSPARPRGATDALHVTWVGHASFLVQVAGLNLLTDPMFSRRASPLSWAGPRRFTAPGLAVADLPPVDAVLISHDHYDHLDDRSVRALVGKHGPHLVWITLRRRLRPWTVLS